jgi:hypothetical protein
MPALTKPRNTPQQAGHRRGYRVGANVRCLAGAIAVLTAGGFAVPATTATGLVALGRFAFDADNTGGANGDQSVEVERGIFRYENSAGADEITAADVGRRCYLVDDQTVAKTSATNTRSVAGFVDGVDELGVWVLLDPTSGAAA